MKIKFGGIDMSNIKLTKAQQLNVGKACKRLVELGVDSNLVQIILADLVADLLKD